MIPDLNDADYREKCMSNASNFKVFKPILKSFKIGLVTLNWKEAVFISSWIKVSQARYM